MFTALKKYISREFIFPKVVLPTSDDMSGVVAVVTGASRGIGNAIVETILSKGGKVVAVSRNLKDLQIAFPEKIDTLLLCEGDITSKADVERIFQDARAAFKVVTVLINNAGINMEKPLEETQLSEFDNMINTNIKGAFLMSQEAIPQMKECKSGLIVNIGSKISHNTNVGPNKVLYTTTKYAIEGFSLALNKELKPFGVRVTCLMPGTVNTFVSTHAEKYLSPYQVAAVISMIIAHEDIDFESVLFKHKNQTI